MSKKYRLSGWMIWAGALALLVAGMSASPVANLAASETSAYSELRAFSEVLSLVEENYVNKVDAKKLIRGAIRGMLRTLDPHTTYLNPEYFKEMQVETTGRFGGLGVEISIRDGVLTVVTPIEDTPAYKAGVQAGDQIILIEEEPTKDLLLQEIVKKLRGKPGTKVKITVRRKGEKELIPFTITRQIIRIKSVRSRMLEDDIAYIRVRSFQNGTGREVKDALSSLEDKGARALVLDLRNNPGGLLSQAVSVSDIFLEAGSLIVYTKGRMTDQEHRFTSTHKALGGKIPMAVLVNAGSASASEIVAGALQDLERAKLIGVKTFGKGSVQTVVPLSDGSGLRLTTALYFTPKGKRIQGEGIEPDIVSEAGTSSGGARMMREKDLPGHLPGEAEKEGEKEDKGASDAQAGPAQTPNEEQKDTQLERAVKYLKDAFLDKKMGA
jgi:carboxyl-terminal processing protease